MKYLLIAGSRDFEDWETFEKVTREYIDGDERFTVIVEGGANGADNMAKRYGVQNGMTVAEIRADWKRYGRAAGPKRNDEMIQLIKEKNGTALYFWDGQSKGTKQCIESARRKGVPVTIWNTAEGRMMEEGV